MNECKNELKINATPLAKEFLVDSRACVMVVSETSAWSPMRVGTRRDYFMSRRLFNVCFVHWRRHSPIARRKDIHSKVR